MLMHTPTYYDDKQAFDDYAESLSDKLKQVHPVYLAIMAEPATSRWLIDTATTLSPSQHMTVANLVALQHCIYDLTLDLHKWILTTYNSPALAKVTATRKKAQNQTKIEFTWKTNREFTATIICDSDGLMQLTARHDGMDAKTLWTDGLTTKRSLSTGGYFIRGYAAEPWAVR